MREMRVTKVNKARKDQGTCNKCGDTINRGDGYLWWKFRYGGRRIRCTKMTCVPQPRDLTQNEIEIGILDAQDYATGAEEIETWDEAQDFLNGLIEELEGICEIIQEKMSNIEYGFGHTSIPAYEELEYKYDEVDSVVNDLRSIYYDEDEFDPTEFVDEVASAIGNL